MKTSRLLLLALLISAALNAGCVGFIRDTYKDYVSPPAPSPSAMPTVTSTPINQTIERQYMFTEKFMAGVGRYNDGIRAFNASRSAYETAAWANATEEIGMAAADMEEARADFQDMKAYTGTPDEVLLSDKWNETAYYQAQAFYFANLSYQEGAYQAARSIVDQNPIKYNYYVSQANNYIALAQQSKAEAEAAEGRTFLGQQG